MANPRQLHFNNRYINLLTKRGLIQKIVTPTRISPTSSTIIDHVICHRTHRLTCSVVEAPFTDHMATFTIVNEGEEDTPVQARPAQARPTQARPAQVFEVIEAHKDLESVRNVNISVDADVQAQIDADFEEMFDEEGLLRGQELDQPGCQEVVVHQDNDQEVTQIENSIVCNTQVNNNMIVNFSPRKRFKSQELEQQQDLQLLLNTQNLMNKQTDQMNRLHENYQTKHKK
jgi:hypothetical protein